MAASRTTVLIAGGRSPDRAIALELLLREAAGLHGWSERLTIRCGGLGPAGGRISDAGVTALRAFGVNAYGAVCPDLERRPDLFEDCDLIVCDCADAADALVDWEEASGAEFLCLDDLVEGETEADDDETPIARDIAEIDSLVPEVLRRIIARPGDA